MSERQDRTAIVTGAGKRVGAAVAAALLDDGWTVLAHVHDASDPVPGNAAKVAADLSEAASADTIIAALAGLPPPRLLINNAARFAWDGPGEWSAAELDAHLAVNLRAPIALTERFAELQDRSADSLVINILDSKIVAPNPDFFSYTVSKQALAAATVLAARAFARRGVRVNGIAPALMIQSPGQTEENFRAMHSNNPLGRGVTPRDVVGAIRYMVDAPTLTGQLLVLDSGQRFMGLTRDVQFLEDE